jgi:hypothetical protein
LAVLDRVRECNWRVAVEKNMRSLSCTEFVDPALLVHDCGVVRWRLVRRAVCMAAVPIRAVPRVAPAVW